MGVRQLAGPFNLTYNSGSVPVFGAGPSRFIWFPGVGLLMITASGITGLNGGFVSLVSPDGIIAPHAMGTDSGWAVDPSAKTLRSLAGSSDDVLYEPIGLATYASQSRFPVDLWDNNVATFADVPGRRLAAVNFGGTRGLMALSASGTVQEASLPTQFGIWPGNLSVGRNEHEVMVSEFPNSPSSILWFQFYDTNAKAYSSQPMCVESIKLIALVFSVDLGVLFSVHGPTSSGDNTPYTLNIWSLDVIPTTISAVQLIAGSTGQGQVATYQVKVTGDQGEACDGVVVQWSNSGSGSLLQNTSVTDENGYAECQVQFALGVTGQATLTATVNS